MVGIGPGQVLRHPGLHREGHQLLLRTVVDIALDPTPLPVLGRH